MLHAMHVVALSVGQHLRADEERNALHAFGRADDAGQHHVDDVVRHVVLAVGDEDLGAEELVAAIGLRLGARAHQRQVAAGLRLGQVHRARPRTVDHLRDVGLLLLRRAGRQQRFDGAVGQQRAQRKAHVGAVEHFDAGRADRLRQALAAERDRVLQALPTALGELLEGGLEARRRRDLAVLERRRVLVALPVQRRDDVLIELGGFFEHGRGRVEPRLLQARHARHGFEVGELFHAEEHVLDGGAVSHRCRLLLNSVRAELVEAPQPFDRLRANGVARLQRLDQLGHGR